MSFRNTTQFLAPAVHPSLSPGQYDIYPGFPLGAGKIMHGFDSLAEAIVASHQQTILVDGYSGVLWKSFRAGLNDALTKRGATACWRSINEILKSPSIIEEQIKPYLGGDDPLFGKRCELQLMDFFDEKKLREFKSVQNSKLTICFGCGAALFDDQGFLMYVDVPKNEIQFRSRAGSIHNLGAEAQADPKAMYKRFYFVDWPVLNSHRVDILDRIDLIIDGQRPDEPTAMAGTDFRNGLDIMAENLVRVRPWFEPGPWGGQWIKTHIPQLQQDVPNYAWSFELISPENGIAFESDGKLCEVSFDFLMFHNHREVLGEFADRIGNSFPIRYDFLDTFDGGNLSLQCHPRPEYSYKHFGEHFTQDETYYILDCTPDAKVYLGFNDNVDVQAFRSELERSVKEGGEVDVEHFVNMEQARKHDLFLIPHGTIHCSGKNNLVLEISATPYIFTFKMYDWMRMDLEGNPRTLNIGRAFENLNFERRGEDVKKELVSHPILLNEGNDWKLFHLPTHPDHFYDVHRFEFGTSVEAKTEGSCHVMNVVEGESVTVETGNGMQQEFNYAETFIVPAAARSYRLTNNGKTLAKVVKTFLKPTARPFAPPHGARG